MLSSTLFHLFAIQKQERHKGLYLHVKDEETAAEKGKFFHTPINNQWQYWDFSQIFLPNIQCPLYHPT